MAHWFHRNPLKATAPTNFEVKMVVQDVEALKVLSDLKQSRARMLELLPDPHHDIPKIESALKLYLAVLRGFLEPPSNQNNKSDEEGAPSGGTRASKLRLAVRFRWSQSMLGTSTPEAQNDAAFEVANMLMNVAFWHMKHAAMIAAKDDLKIEEAKDIHTSLRKAAGLINFVKDTLIPQLIEKPVSGSDLDVRVVSAYLNQCTAEAQEVTIARAIELKHNPGLISALAKETSNMYTTAHDSLESLDPKVFGHWKLYFGLKSKFYLSYAYNYKGDALLSQDECGSGIRSLQESQKCYNESIGLAKEYAKTKGPGTQAKPEQHAFFRRLLPIVKRTLEKCERENGFIYHQKVPYDPPDLEVKDKTFGLVAPEEYALPTTAPLWTPVAYAAFDVAMEDKNEKEKKKKQPKDEDIKPVKEVEIKQSDKEDDNACIIS